MFHIHVILPYVSRRILKPVGSLTKHIHKQVSFIWQCTVIVYGYMLYTELSSSHTKKQKCDPVTQKNVIAFIYNVIIYLLKKNVINPLQVNVPFQTQIISKYIKGVI